MEVSCINLYSDSFKLSYLSLQKIKSSHQAMLMIKSTQVDFFVAIVKKCVMWYDKSRKEKNQYE